METAECILSIFFFFFGLQGKIAFNCLLIVRKEDETEA